MKVTCIITVVGAQQQHIGMFLKHGAGGGGAKIFQQCHGGGGGKNFPTVSWGEAFFPTHSRGWGTLFFLPIDFAEPPPPPPPP